MFKLSPESIEKIIKVFPKIKDDFINQINICLDDKLRQNQRLSKMKKEHLFFTGLCGEVSNNILKILSNHYDVKLLTGRFVLDHHPRFPDKKIFALHTWLEIGDKIVDFTASQFNPFLNHQLPELHITSKSDPRYIWWTGQMPTDYIDVGLDDETILEYYINSL